MNGEYQEHHYKNIEDTGVAYNYNRIWVCLNGQATLRAKVMSSGELFVEFHPPGEVKERRISKKTALEIDRFWADSAKLKTLTIREKEILELIALGLNNKEMARELTVNESTVDSHRTSLMEKLDLHKATHLVRYAIRIGLIEA